MGTAVDKFRKLGNNYLSRARGLKINIFFITGWGLYKDTDDAIKKNITSSKCRT